MSQMHELLSNRLSFPGVSCPVSLSPKKLFHQSQNICQSSAPPRGKLEIHDNGLVFRVACNVLVSIALTYLFKRLPESTYHISNWMNYLQLDLEWWMKRLTVLLCWFFSNLTSGVLSLLSQLDGHTSTTDYLYSLDFTDSWIIIGFHSSLSLFVSVLLWNDKMMPDWHNFHSNWFSFSCCDDIWSEGLPVE